jgi:hypothetical protein
VPNQGYGEAVRLALLGVCWTSGAYLGSEVDVSLAVARQQRLDRDELSQPEYATLGAADSVSEETDRLTRDIERWLEGGYGGGESRMG